MRTDRTSTTGPTSHHFGCLGLATHIFWRQVHTRLGHLQDEVRAVPFAHCGTYAHSQLKRPPCACRKPQMPKPLVSTLGRLHAHDFDREPSPKAHCCVKGNIFALLSPSRRDFAALQQTFFAALAGKARNFETFTTKLETPSCNLKSTKLFQSAANKLHEDLAKTWHSQPKRSFALELLFLGLEPTHGRRLHSNKLQAFPAAVRQAGSFLYGLTAHKTKSCAGKLI